VWIALKDCGRWGEPRYFSLLVSEFLAARERVRVAFADWCRRNPRPQDRLGFAPRTFAASAAEQVGLLAPSGFDRIILSYALYQRVRYWDGARTWTANGLGWETGPHGRPKMLTAIYDEKSLYREESSG